jgi:hypothetical protein
VCCTAKSVSVIYLSLYCSSTSAKGEVRKASVYRPLSVASPPYPLSSRPRQVMRTTSVSQPLLDGSAALPFVHPERSRGNKDRLPANQPPSMSTNYSSCQRRSPLCHPERSRGICSSADHPWKCFSISSGNLPPAFQTYLRSARPAPSAAGASLLLPTFRPRVQRFGLPCVR